MPLGEACAKLYERIPVAEANFFGSSSRFQQKAAAIYRRLSAIFPACYATARKMKAKIQAMSMEAKASAMIIGVSAAWGDVSRLHHEPPIHRAAFGPSRWPYDAGGLRNLDVHGVMVMRKMINFDF